MAFALGLAALVTIGTVEAAPVSVDLSGYTVGTSIEGVEIDASVGLRIFSDSGVLDVISASGGPTAYGAPNYGSDTKGPDGTLHGMSGFPMNGCLNGLGFADTWTANRSSAPGFTFTFGVPIHAFSVRMLDFGDFNPTNASYHLVVMTARDGDGNVVDTQVLEYTSAATTNPRSGTLDGQPVDFIYAGDACWAPEYADVKGKPITGVWTWLATDDTGAGIEEISLDFESGWDPKIGFDNLQYEEFSPPTTVGLCAGQHTEVGTVTVSSDADGVCVRYDTTDGWGMTEIHLAVVSDVADFPMTKSGNPKVGHFPVSRSWSVPVTSEEICLTWEELGIEPGEDVLVAAHAVVVNGDQQETAWPCDGMDFGGKSWATWFSHGTR